MGPNTLPTIWHIYMKLVTIYQISAINSCAALRRKSKDMLARNQNNVSEWSDTCLLADCCFSELAL
jgi:hypothetical protein